MATVFISHVEEDGVCALEIALELEKAAYSAWCYEHDSIAGTSYLARTGKEIDDCQAFVLLISKNAFGAHQITKEVVRAHERNKRFFPVLRDVSHLEFQEREPEWRTAVGAATSISFTSSGSVGVARRIAQGLDALEIPTNSGPAAGRVASIEARLLELRGTPPGLDEKPVSDGSRFRRGVKRPRGVRAFFGVSAGLLLCLGALGLWNPTIPPSSKSAQIEEPIAVGIIAVGIVELKAQGLQEGDEWICQQTRDALNTLLTKGSNLQGRKLRVYSKEKIDFLVRKRGLSEIEVAEQLQMTQMISGSLSHNESGLAFDVRIVETQSGEILDSASFSGPKDGLIELQNEMGDYLLTKLGVQLDQSARQQLFAQRTNETQEGWERLYGTFGGAPPASSDPHARRGEFLPDLHLLANWFGASVAFAQDPKPLGQMGCKEFQGGSSEEADICVVVQHFALALEHESMDELAALYVEFTEPQRQAFHQYFENAEGLKVQFSDLDILVDEDEALASFMRSDVFTDRRTGREVKLEVRLSTLLSKQEGVWKIMGLNRS